MTKLYTTLPGGGRGEGVWGWVGGVYRGGGVWGWWGSRGGEGQGSRGGGGLGAGGGMW